MPSPSRSSSQRSPLPAHYLFHFLKLSYEIKSIRKFLSSNNSNCRWGLSVYPSTPFLPLDKKKHKRHGAEEPIYFSPSLSMSCWLALYTFGQLSPSPWEGNNDFATEVLSFQNFSMIKTITRPNSWAKQVREIEWRHRTLDFMIFRCMR